MTASYSSERDAIHVRLAERYPKRDVCEHCGRGRADGERAFDYAFLRHPEPHTERREDYAELCQPCHGRIDAPGRGQRYRDERLRLGDPYATAKKYGFLRS